jgi:hypothetical protein
VLLASGSRLRSLAVAAVTAALLLVVTRQLGPGGCHAPHGYYRAQVDAFLGGRLALTEHPDGLVHDLAWTESGVQQVWGLGAPAWQTPFEAAGRAVGVSPVPDRIAMLAWLALMIYALHRGFRRRDREPWWVSAGTVVIAALLPGFVALLRGKLGVYEEAALYAYSAAMMMLGGLACFVRRPTAAGYVLLVGLAGLGGLFRPTVWFYGAATLVVATIVWVHHVRARASVATTTRGPGPGAGGGRWARAVALGVALFVAGGGLLYATNARRFGRGAEFGHRLNLHSLPGNIMATRFGYPFERASAGQAAAELFGGLFDRPEQRSKRGFYQTGLHLGQQPIPRWREYYFSTYSWPYAPLLVAGLVLAALAWRRRIDADPAARWLGPWALLGLLPLLIFYLWSPAISSRYQLDLAPGFVALLAIAWRSFARYARAGVAITALLLAWGGAVATSKVTRPRTGGGPVSAATAAEAAYRISRPLPAARALPAGHDADDPAWGTHSDIAAAFVRCADFAGAPVSCDAPPLPGDLRVVGARDAAGWLVRYVRISDMPELADGAPPLCRPAEPADPAGSSTSSAAEPPRCDGPPTIGTDPDAVALAEVAAPQPLYLDAFGWDLETRRVSVATYFFAEDPRFVELEIEHAPEGDARAITDWTREVRVAVGLIHLAPVAAADTARGVRLRFEAPAPLRPGLQVIFVAFGPDDRLDRPRSDFRLHAIRWR